MHIVPASNGRWTETVRLVAVSSLLVYGMTRPAFDAYFLGENFIYVGQYYASDHNFWHAIFSPVLGIFFRPVLIAVSILSDFVVPLDPWPYHFRNFTFCTLNLLLLHRVLLRLVASQQARAFALGLFALSKIHLTTIGYINTLDEILLLTLTLLTMLFLIRYVDRKRPLDYGLTLLFFLLTIFSKDYGLAVIGPMVALVVGREISSGDSGVWRDWVWKWAWRSAPVAAIVALYLGLRYTLVGVPPSDNAVYTPAVSLEIVLRKLVLFTSTIGNISLLSRWSAGESGLSARLGGWLPYSFTWLLIEATFYIGFMSLVAVTFWQGRRAGWQLLMPGVWVLAFLAPTLITRNMQIYYFLAPLAGLTVALGLCWDQLRPRWRQLWIVALVIIGLNGTLSNYSSRHAWLRSAQAAQRIEQTVLAPHRGKPLESITFVTSSLPFWQFTLNETMVRELMAMPQLRVLVIDYQELPAKGIEPNATNLLIDLDRSM